MSHVVVCLDLRVNGLRLEVHDLGHGVLGPTTSMVAAGQTPAGHGGPSPSPNRSPSAAWPRDLDQHPSVMAMRHRANEVGARLTLRSEPWQGTRLILRWQA
jgi:hypothetical protein